jgi:hypothetical protein
MDRQAIRQQLPVLVAKHIPSNASKINYDIIDGKPKESMMGFRVDPQPFEGKVVVTTDEAIIVKTGRTTFAVLDRSLVTTVPMEGSKVSVQPYARRRFDGKRADTPEEVTRRAADGTTYTVQSIVLGSAPAKLPVPPVQCLELQQLIEQLESLPAPDRHRTITHMLVDAKASDFTVVDPKPSDIIDTPPTISFTVSTAKFQGRVSVIYLRGMDVYAIELHRDGELIERIDEVYFDSLGEILARRIDDGTWRRIQVLPASGRKTVSH